MGSENVTKQYKLSDAEYPVAFNYWILGFVLLVIPIALGFIFGLVAGIIAAATTFFVCVHQRLERDIIGNSCFGIIDDNGLTCLKHNNEGLNEYLRTTPAVHRIYFSCNLRTGVFTPFGPTSVESLKHVAKIVVERGGASLMVTNKYGERFKLTKFQLATCYEQGLPILQALFKSPAEAINAITGTLLWKSVEDVESFCQKTAMNLAKDYEALDKSGCSDAKTLELQIYILEQIKKLVCNTAWRDTVTGMSTATRLRIILQLHPTESFQMAILSRITHLNIGLLQRK